MTLRSVSGTCAPAAQRRIADSARVTFLTEETFVKTYSDLGQSSADLSQKVKGDVSDVLHVVLILSEFATIEDPVGRFANRLPVR